MLFRTTEGLSIKVMSYIRQSIALCPRPSACFKWDLSPEFICYFGSFNWLVEEWAPAQLRRNIGTYIYDKRLVSLKGFWVRDWRRLLFSKTETNHVTGTKRSIGPSHFKFYAQ